MIIKELVEGLINTYNTNNPFIIAKHLGIIVKSRQLGNTLGYFCTYKRFKLININDGVSGHLKDYVCAHELGHAIMHKHVNTPYLKSHTFFSTDKIEKQANTFAVELLLPDEYLREYPHTSIECLAKCKGVPIRLVGLKKCR